MIVPYHSIHKSLLIITRVFHSLYYEDRAMAIRIDFWPASEFIPHTNHTHWSSELQVTVLHYPGLNRGFGRHHQYSRIVPATEVSKVYQGCAPRPHRSPQPSPIQRMVARLPAWIVFRLHGWNDLSFHLSVGHAFNMTRGPSTIGP